jgi:HEAT repeat protein
MQSMLITRYLVRVVIGFLLLGAFRINGQQPETVEDALARHHIAITEVSLISALKSPESEVRNLAAQKLAIDRDKDAIPAIQNALNMEEDAGNQVSIAYALVQLGDEKAITAIRSICDNGNLNGSTRLLAAQTLLVLKEGYCLNDVLDLALPSSDPHARAEALSVLLSYRAFPGFNPQRVVLLAVDALQDPTPSVRLAASDVLATLGGASEIPSLQEAINKEDLEAVRSTMETDLLRLRNRP